VVRRLGFIGVDNRDRTVRVVDQTAADRTQHQAAECTHAPASNDDYLRLLGGIDKRRYDARIPHLGVDGGRLRFTQTGMKRLLRLLDDVPRVILLPLSDVRL
jgi:hypothetical protein